MDQPMRKAETNQAHFFTLACRKIMGDLCGSPHAVALVGRLVVWLAGWLVDWLVDWSVGWSAGCLWLAGWLIGWLVGWLEDSLVG
jgi:O-antigen/teichoic acid export membrane protein